MPVAVVLVTCTNPLDYPSARALYIVYTPIRRARDTQTRGVT